MFSPLHANAEEIYADLSSNGWSQIPRPENSIDLDELTSDFDGLVQEIGREELAKLTYGNVTGRRGGEYGFLRRVDRIESKDAFMLRSVEPDLSQQALPTSLLEFMRNGRELVHESQVAFRGIMTALDAYTPGILDFHFGDPNKVDSSVRLVLSDDDEEPSQVVAEPHLDVSSMTMHLRTNRPGTFFIAQPDGRIVFPIVDLRQTALFNGAWFAQTEMGAELKPVFHGAVAGEKTNDKRRGIVVAQIQPNLAIQTPPPSHESTHTSNLDELQARIAAAYLEQVA